MSAIIKPHGCKSCSHSTTSNGQLVCAINPPTAAPVFKIEENGVMRPVGWTSSFPPVAPDLKCGQWRVRLAVATSLEKATI